MTRRKFVGEGRQAGEQASRQASRQAGEQRPTGVAQEGTIRGQIKTKKRVTVERVRNERVCDFGHAARLYVDPSRKRGERRRRRQAGREGGSGERERKRERRGRENGKNEETQGQTAEKGREKDGTSQGRGEVNGGRRTRRRAFAHRSPSFSFLLLREERVPPRLASARTRSVATTGEGQRHGGREERERERGGEGVARGGREIPCASNRDVAAKER